MPEPFKIIVGLGNPGAEHVDTRHNAGFWCADALADEYTGTFRSEAKFFGDVCRIQIKGDEYWLLKPSTYMNNSGRSVQAMLSFYKFDVSELLVIHDEIDLEAGDVRLKKGGGHGGQNGLRDIISQLGSQQFSRLRIGVGHPGDKHKVVNHVLGRASKDDQDKINEAIERALKCLPMILKGDTQKAMNELHGNSKN